MPYYGRLSAQVELGRVQAPRPAPPPPPRAADLALLRACVGLRADAPLVVATRADRRPNHDRDHEETDR